MPVVKSEISAFPVFGVQSLKDGFQSKAIVHFSLCFKLCSKQKTKVEDNVQRTMKAVRWEKTRVVMYKPNTKRNETAHSQQLCGHQQKCIMISGETIDFPQFPE